MTKRSKLVRVQRVSDGKPEWRPAARCWFVLLSVATSRRRCARLLDAPVARCCLYLLLPP